MTAQRHGAQTNLTLSHIWEEGHLLHVWFTAHHRLPPFALEEGMTVYMPVNHVPALPGALLGRECGKGTVDRSCWEMTERRQGTGPPAWV